MFGEVNEEGGVKVGCFGVKGLGFQAVMGLGCGRYAGSKGVGCVSGLSVID